MEKNKGGRPNTGRDTTVSLRLSDEAVNLLKKEKNKSKFVDELICGKIARLKCPHCDNMIDIQIVQE